MNDEEKSQLTGWIVVGVIVAVLAVGIFYANRNTADDLSNISPAAGSYNDTTGTMNNTLDNTLDDGTQYGPTAPPQPEPASP